MRGGDGTAAAAAAAAAASASAALPSSASIALPTSTSTSYSLLALKYLTASAVNATSSMRPTPKDLLLALPRLIVRVGTFAFSTLPDHFDSVLTNHYHMRTIPDATGEGATFAAVTDAATFLQARDAAGTAGSSPLGSGGETIAAAGGFSNGLGFHSVRGFGGILSYLTSRWALSCFTMVCSLDRDR